MPPKIDVSLLTAKRDNTKIGTQVKTYYLNCTKSFAEYQKKCYLNKSEHKSDSIEAMTVAVTKMAEALTSTKTDKINSLEKLSVPVWDGQRKSYLTWKHEFKYWMEKCKQDKEEELPRDFAKLYQNTFLGRPSKILQIGRKSI